VPPQPSDRQPIVRGERAPQQNSANSHYPHAYAPIGNAMVIVKVSMVGVKKASLAGTGRARTSEWAAAAPTQTVYAFPASSLPRLRVCPSAEPKLMIALAFFAATLAAKDFFPRFPVWQGNCATLARPSSAFRRWCRHRLGCRRFLLLAAARHRQ
jgi:hypothetical protein